MFEFDVRCIYHFVEYYPKQEHLLVHCMMLKVPPLQENYPGFFFILIIHHAL